MHNGGRLRSAYLGVLHIVGLTIPMMILTLFILHLNYHNDVIPPTCTCSQILPVGNDLFLWPQETNPTLILPPSRSRPVSLP